MQFSVPPAPWVPGQSPSHPLPGAQVWIAKGTPLVPNGVLGRMIMVPLLSLYHVLHIFMPWLITLGSMV